MKYLRLFFILTFITGFTFAQDHLLISEIVVTPTAGEFIEIHNPTANSIDLSEYYLTDATSVSEPGYYYNIVRDSLAGGNSAFDFHVRFPNGASSISPGEYQTVAINGDDFASTYSLNPTYEINSTDPNVTDMMVAFGTVGGSVGLTNGGEVVILYQWDGSSDLVNDIDYLVWGDKNEAVDKTNVSIDGPDPDTLASDYLADTPINQQISASSTAPHGDGESIQRL
ncbi:MAG: deoxyribonuclease, partial [Aliifodinibius sp.]|nr:lamin tail domain-containing protein [Fodinibius sp.]NIV14738.1 deoxyribonuclease [Fodinibius sp.]NIY28633.1 deoxyribonuclease [Fodinibius sp.]